MGLITFIILTALSLLYLARSNKANANANANAGAIAKAVKLMEENLDKFTSWSAIYGLISFVIAIVTIHNVEYMFINIIANVMIVMLSLPFVFKKMSINLEGKVNPIIIKEVGHIINFVTRHGKIFGFISAVASVLLFVDIFKINY